jgi:hypothetical protein
VKPTPIGAFVAGVFVACGSGAEPRTAPAPCRSQPEISDLSLLPKDVPVAEHGRVVDAEVEGGYVGVTVVSETQVVELYPPLARALLDAGYEIVASDNEGFEAEIFFARGRATDGAIRLREGPCPGEVTIKLLYGSPDYRGKRGAP